MINIDRLNDLPDHVIHKVLSFLDLKQAIQTCVLSKRWRFPWTSLPCLKFDSYRPEYMTPKDFSDFVTKSKSLKTLELSSVAFYRLPESLALARPPLPSLNFADIHVRRPSSDDLERNLKETRNLINVFRGLHNARFVRISSETIEVLNLVPGLQARKTDLPLQKIEVFESAWRG
ncbi:hypothetical protein Peur_031497 [Populus x canadensis]